MKKGTVIIMKPFLNNDFLLSNEIARQLYHQAAEPLPIIDYHCHIQPKEIADNRQFKNLTELWLEGDHYKWRLMRANGVNEDYITGDADPYEKYLKWVETLEKAIGNPLYHWSHLELKRYFGYQGIINSKSAEDIWKLCTDRLSKKEMRAVGIMEQSKVKLICTTDDPIDSLQYHEEIAANQSIHISVLPTFRPDRAMDIEKQDYRFYIKELEKACGFQIYDFELLKKAIVNRLEFFITHGCRLSDHGFTMLPYRIASPEIINSIFIAKMQGNQISLEDALCFKTAFMLFVAKEYYRLGCVMQLHFGCKRDNNSLCYEKLGANTGFDCIHPDNHLINLTGLLDSMNKEGTLPKTILYSLNPTDNAALQTMIGCFQNSDYIGKIQLGSAWWFNDHKSGIEDQLAAYAAYGLLPTFVGMLTDSRSFVSYVRHEYFRRILCNYIGSLVESGEYPYDIETLKKFVTDISYHNAKNYFNFVDAEIPGTT